MNLDKESIKIKLLSNFKSNINESTNPLRKNEYTNTMIIPQLRNQTKWQIELEDENIGPVFVTFVIEYAYSKFFLVVNLYNDDSDRIKPSVLSKITYNKIVTCIQNYIEECNSANVQFVNFEDPTDGSKDGFYRIFNGYVFGAFYDLKNDRYIELDKPIKTTLVFEHVDESEIRQALDDCV